MLRTDDAAWHWLPAFQIENPLPGDIRVLNPSTEITSLYTYPDQPRKVAAMEVDSPYWKSYLPALSFSEAGHFGYYSRLPTVCLFSLAVARSVQTMVHRLDQALSGTMVAQLYCSILVFAPGLCRAPRQTTTSPWEIQTEPSGGKKLWKALPTST